MRRRSGRWYPAPAVPCCHECENKRFTPKLNQSEVLDGSNSMRKPRPFQDAGRRCEEKKIASPPHCPLRPEVKRRGGGGAPLALSDERLPVVGIAFVAPLHDTPRKRRERRQRVEDDPCGAVGAHCQHGVTAGLSGGVKKRRRAQRARFVVEVGGAHPLNK